MAAVAAAGRYRGDVPVMHGSDSVWVEMAARVAAVRGLVEEERLSRDLDDQCGVRHRRSHEEQLLGMWVAENADRILRAAGQPRRELVLAAARQVEAPFLVPDLYPYLPGWRPAAIFHVLRDLWDEGVVDWSGDAGYAVVREPGGETS